MVKPGYILTIDQGTNKTRVFIIDKNGNLLEGSRKKIKKITSHNGWVEYDPNDIWLSVKSAISEVFSKNGIKPIDINAIGIANQRETTVIWDKTTGKPIYNAISWRSRQSEEIANDLISKGYLKMMREKTGLTIDPYFSATKIRWILDHVEGAQSRAEKGELAFGTIDSWLLWNLTEGNAHYTDYTNASRTMLYNIHELKWDDDLLNLFNIPKLMLPEVKSNSEEYGRTSAKHFYGLNVPITGMIGNQQATLFGLLATEEGMVKSTYGTGTFIVMNTGGRAIAADDYLFTTIGYVINDKVTYALEGSILHSGEVLKWLIEKVDIVENFDELEEQAEKSVNSDNLYIVPAFAGLGAPIWNQKARGSVFGLTEETQIEDIVNAVLRSLAYQVRDVIELLELETNIRINLLKVDGGSSQNNTLMQFQSDILGIDIERGENAQATSLGAAYLAGLAIGYWSDIEEIKKIAKESETFSPCVDRLDKEKLYKGWKNATQAIDYYTKKQKNDV